VTAQPGLGGPPRTTTSAFLATVTLILLSIAALFAMDTFLANLDRAETRSEARRLFEEGRRLAERGRDEDAVERFRSALSIERDNPDYRLALAQVLLAAGRLPDAEAGLGELLRHDATSAVANLTMARVLAREGRTAEAISYYHRAIYGRWPADPAQQRVAVRFELIDLLARQNARQELLAELLPLEQEAPKDLDTRKRIGRLFLVAGSPVRAADVFRSILREHPGDPDAVAGLGEAAFARADYRTAHKYFLLASKLRPDDRALAARLKLCSDVLALDPLLRGLGLKERYRRSRTLLELALGRVEACAGADLPPAAGAVLAAARQEIAHPVAVGRQDDAFEVNLDLAGRLWEVREARCPAGSAPADQPLDLVLAQLAD
jgi:tetratricopeptide (TPR) repeat protein